MSGSVRGAVRKGRPYRDFLRCIMIQEVVVGSCF
jgi:hypothetical protein